MKYWRKNANKVAVTVDNGDTIILTGRELCRYMKRLSSNQKPASNLMIALIKRI